MQYISHINLNIPYPRAHVGWLGKSPVSDISTLQPAAHNRLVGCGLARGSSCSDVATWKMCLNRRLCVAQRHPVTCQPNKPPQRLGQHRLTINGLTLTVWFNLFIIILGILNVVLVRNLISSKMML